MTSTQTRINRALRKHGLRLYRAREGYYYFGGVNPLAYGLPSIYVYRLEPQDFEFARNEINAILREANLAPIE